MIPYIPLELREGWNSERATKSGSNLPQIFVLGCTQRKASLKQMKEDRWMKFQYCVPYILNPKYEEEKEQNTVVEFFFPREPQLPLGCELNWDMDEVEDFTDKLIEDEELSEDKKEAFMEFLNEEVKNAKKNKREARKKRMEDPKYQEAKTYHENMRLYKIYPVQIPNTPVIEMKSHYVNFYYRFAHEII
ncbi:hypothetical protein RchiOBHm_Chr3g0459621 [Rosa chinensis]|uniref:Uncharacterized protein n=1 Tax=Rosa chinensis TaxID=74649 RepID=A0A2P6R878_ROSCH|nr:protein HEAT INTOLERANT 4 [Rosa chinensis]PRQ42621.1 hypothetical protein RchiOBHm_Chr3g0459621 [Rosa chinensis]